MFMEAKLLFHFDKFKPSIELSSTGWVSYVAESFFAIMLMSKSFCSQKGQYYSRAYLDFKRPEGVIEFAEFFDGHVFVNEKGNLGAHLLSEIDYSCNLFS